MIRADDVSWEADRGRAALEVAAARAGEAASDCPLFTDAWAGTLVDAAAGSRPEFPASTIDHAAARTKWFDDYFLSASAAGVSQVVILSAGLDTRAWRLPWLSDTVIFEVDQPKVLAFKTATMDSSEAQLAAKYMPVGVDLTDDWPRALRAAGFDHEEPTAWAAEALLPNLPAGVADRILEQIALYSARGSRIALEACRDTEDGASVAQWLCCHHWDITSTDVSELLIRYHRDPSEARSVFVQGHLL